MVDFGSARAFARSTYSENAEHSRMCTASWPVLDSRRRLGVLTAGHCLASEDASLWMLDKSNAPGPSIAEHADGHRVAVGDFVTHLAPVLAQDGLRVGVYEDR